MDPLGKDWLDGVGGSAPFILAAGQAQPRVSTVRIVEAVVTAVVVAMIVGMGTYFFAIPRIEATIATQGAMTRLELDFVQRQIADARSDWARGQESDRRERAVLDTRVRDIETRAPRAVRPPAD